MLTDRGLCCVDVLDNINAEHQVSGGLLYNAVCSVLLGVAILCETAALILADRGVCYVASLLRSVLSTS